MIGYLLRFVPLGTFCRQTTNDVITQGQREKGLSGRMAKDQRV